MTLFIDFYVVSFKYMCIRAMYSKINKYLKQNNGIQPKKELCSSFLEGNTKQQKQQQVKGISLKAM